MWLYAQDSGWLVSAQGARLVQCYSGHGIGKNNPAMEGVRDTGPIPVGTYTINAPVDTETHGPYVLWLTPDYETLDHMLAIGRAPENPNLPDFGIHGERRVPPAGEASLGCIIEPFDDRKILWGSGDHILRVVPTLTTEDSLWPNA